MTRSTYDAHLPHAGKRPRGIPHASLRPLTDVEIDRIMSQSHLGGSKPDIGQREDDPFPKWPT